MTLKTLLLGSAAAFAVVGGAQAADLSVAEPVEYVKVCDYFGTGYFYIPGTDTCLKISGYVEENAAFGANAVTLTSGPHSASWDFSTVMQLDVSTKSMTEYGELDGLVSFSGHNNPNEQLPVDSGRGSVALGDDGAWLSLGGFKAGAYQSAAFTHAGAFTDINGPASSQIYGNFSYDLLNSFQLSWAAGGMSASVAISDPTAYFGSNLPTSYSVPLITGNIGWGASGNTFTLSGGYVGLSNLGSNVGSWGIDGSATLAFGKSDNIALNAAFGDNAFISNNVGVANGTNNGYSLMGSWQHNLSKALSFAATASWAQWSGISTTGYGLSGNLIWTPVNNFEVIGAVAYSNNTGASSSTQPSAWSASLTTRRSW